MFHVKQRETQMKKQNTFFIILALFIVIFSGCGGGGGSDDLKSDLSNVKGTVTDLNNEPVTNATVTLLKEKKSVYTTKTDTDGDFVFKNINPAYYLVQIEKNGEKVSTYVEAEPKKTITIPKEETVLGSKKGSAEISIYINGSPQSNIKVILSNNTYSLNALTDTNGKALFSNILTGTYKVKAEGYGSETKINVSENQTSKAVLNLESETKITFIFYGNSYNLDSGLTNNIKQMFEYGSTGKVNIIVFYKTSVSGGVYRGKVEKAQGTITKGLKNIGNKNFGDPNVLKDYIHWVKENYPAETYVLDLWNHGTGWTPYWDTKAINHDNDYSDWLECYEVHNALSGENIPYICCDACMMGMLEFYTEIRNDAEICMASEYDIPSSGYDYSVLLKYLNKENSVTDAFAKFGKEQIQNISWERLGTDIQVVKLSQIDNVNSSIKPIAGFLTANSKIYKSEIKEAQYDTEILTHFSKDLKTFLSHVAENIDNKEFSSLVTNYNNAAGKALIYSGNTEKTHGFAINLPNKTQYKTTFAGSYPNTDFAIATGWDEFLASQE